MKELEKIWEEYSKKSVFNLRDIPIEIQKIGIVEEYSKDSIIVEKGEYPNYIYFICSGVVIGNKEFENGNKYNYFQLDKSNGSIGLLEILAQKKEYVSTITSKTKVKVLKIPSYIIYKLIMEDKELLQKCVYLLSIDLYKTSGNEGKLYYLDGINRIRKYFVEQFLKYENTQAIIIDDRYHEIASEIGMSTRTVGRNLKKLKENGEIYSERRKIIINKEQFLKLKENLKE